MRTSGLSRLSPTDVRPSNKSMLRFLRQFGRSPAVFPRKKGGVIATPYDPAHGEDNLSETQSAHRRGAEGAGDDPNQRGHTYREQCRSQE